MSSELARQGIIVNNNGEMHDFNHFNYCFNSTRDSLPQNLPNVYENEQRNLSHHRARIALSKLLKQEEYKYELLEITNHHYLKNWPQYKVSLSHTTDLGAACICEHVQSLGIDIELSTREVKDNIYKYFKHEDDDPNWSPIELWVLKEAAFKALSPLIAEEEKLNLSKISVQENMFYYGDYSGHLLIKTVNLFEEEYLFSIAYLD